MRTEAIIFTLPILHLKTFKLFLFQVEYLRRFLTGNGINFHKYAQKVRKGIRNAYYHVLLHMCMYLCAQIYRYRNTFIRDEFVWKNKYYTQYDVQQHTYMVRTLITFFILIHNYFMFLLVND